MSDKLKKLLQREAATDVKILTGTADRSLIAARFEELCREEELHLARRRATSA